MLQNNVFETKQHQIILHQQLSNPDETSVLAGHQCDQIWRFFLVTLLAIYAASSREPLLLKINTGVL